MRSLLAGVVFILVEDDVDRAIEAIGELLELLGCQMGAEGAGGVAKAGLPQYRQVEQAFDQDHGVAAADRLPGEQAAFGARQQAVGEGGAGPASLAGTPRP